MRQPLRPEDHPTTLDALQTRRLIADIGRVVEIISSDIANEEALAGISDPSRPEYPILARALAARRANLLSTMASLQQRIDHLSRTAAQSREPAHLGELQQA